MANRRQEVRRKRPSLRMSNGSVRLRAFSAPFSLPLRLPQGGPPSRSYPTTPFPFQIVKSSYSDIPLEKATSSHSLSTSTTPPPGHRTSPPPEFRSPT